MKRVQQLSKWFIGLMILAVLSGSTWQSWRWWTWAIAPIAPVSASEKLVTLNIPQGTTAQEIGKDLQALGLIRSTNAWDLWARWLALKQPDGGFKAGTYEIAPTESLQAIAAKIWTGEVVQVSFTIPEGWSLRDMAAYFEKQGFFSAQDFLAAAEKLSIAEYPWLPTDVPNGFPKLEGYLYPDTYQVSGAVSPDDVLQQMLDRFEQVALPLYQQAKGKTTLSLAQWITLSSIVEREAVVASERPRIAGVFLNRLQKDVPLGADPTVEYGLGIRQTPDKPLTFEQVNTPSPYNTYVNPGLPPTAIASPGLASLKAVLTPESTDYLYFVARYDGTHVFSRTLAEHQAAQSAIHNSRDAAKPSSKTGRSN